MNDCKSPQVYRILFSILADLNNDKVVTVLIIIVVIIIIIIIYHTPLKFFTSVLADGFTQEFEGQQVSSSLQDSSLDSGCS